MRGWFFEAGGAIAVLIGGDGDGLVVGGPGGDVLIGGIGSDSVREADTVTADVAVVPEIHATALQSLLDEWTAGQSDAAAADLPGAAGGP